MQGQAQNFSAAASDSGEQHGDRGRSARTDGHDAQVRGREVIEQGEQLYEDLRAVADRLRGVAADWHGVLRERLEQRPYAVLAIAAGAGYVLGGGLPRGVARALISLAIGQAIQQALPPPSS